MRMTLEGISGSPEIHLEVLNAICDFKGTESVLDLMCCEGNSTRYLKVAKRILVDIQYRKVEKKESDMFVVSDVFNFLDHDAYMYDAAFCLDGIEHLSRGDGFRLMDQIQKSADKVIFFTPLGSYCVTDDDDPDHHHSAWLPEDFEAFGYSTLVFPQFHETLKFGAFFAFKCTDFFSIDNQRLSQELVRIFNAFKQFPWIQL